MSDMIWLTKKKKNSGKKSLLLVYSEQIKKYLKCDKAGKTFTLFFHRGERNKKTLWKFGIRSCQNCDTCLGPLIEVDVVLPMFFLFTVLMLEQMVYMALW
jgi:hypothetical protein